MRVIHDQWRRTQCQSPRASTQTRGGWLAGWLAGWLVSWSSGGQRQRWFLVAARGSRRGRALDASDKPISPSRGVRAARAAPWGSRIHLRSTSVVWDSALGARDGESTEG
ncbi:hypothetical protein DENSPDRAFT_621406 [Dentipellis sp. KUC8613]|nr:hypothetical protein DENSPDRAFT_621406 [Dentipellis sp. KUC8613]